MTAKRDLLAEKARLLEEQARRARGRRLFGYYPDEGPLARSGYPRHMEFFRLGADHRQRLMLAANRVGKTEGVGGYELALHLTGLYPDWWEGRRFHRPIRAWAAGDTSETTRDILQRVMLGEPGEPGTGLIPSDSLRQVVRRGGGVADAVDRVRVAHVSGGTSTLKFKSFDQKRRSFQGTAQDVVWLDEEPPMDVYAECLMRTMTTGGLVMLTFTPLLGLSEVVLSFLPGGEAPAPGQGENGTGKAVVAATWDDAPHLSPEAREELWAACPPHQREARSRGVPRLGAGAVYPVAEDEVKVEDFPIPPHWPRAFGLDVGWRATAAVWGAWDPATDSLYLYAEYKRGLAEPEVHAAALKARGGWIGGVVDPAARGRAQADGARLMDIYQERGLELTPADNGVESGLYSVWSLLSTGRLKVFASLSGFFEEYRLYRRDEQGRVVKERDHLLDAARYLVMSGRDASRPLPARLLLEGEGAATSDYELFQ
ncbi:terminase large subunit domain-containing protein [Desulfohalovibrio reitneri]|uniref:terminase large subunit domain-containing protein n=1 Tax=Desulfohalovibrio reitneri TaxID=1307759 RepID=UPI000AA45E10|nr:terminase family protein [Desulfohalovibrio reitneri]